MRVFAKYIFTTCALLIALQASPAAAQGRGSVELGFDAAFIVSIFDDLEVPGLGTFETDNLYTLAIPVQSFRAGFFVGENTQIEPSLAISFLSQSGVSLTQLGFQLDLVQNFGVASGGTMPFLRAGGQVFFIDIEDVVDGARFGVDAGGGVKVRAGDRFAVRLDGGVARFFETDDFLGNWNLSASIGLSFFTR